MDKVKLEEKRQREKEIVSFMIGIYCRGKHKTKDGLCPSCQSLADYASDRTEHCPHMETKTFCSRCKTHCYKAEMRESIRQVMRYAGPRMLLYYPVEAVKHAFGK